MIEIERLEFINMVLLERCKQILNLLESGVVSFNNLHGLEAKAEEINKTRDVIKLVEGEMKDKKLSVDEIIDEMEDKFGDGCSQAMIRREHWMQLMDTLTNFESSNARYEREKKEDVEVKTRLRDKIRELERIMDGEPR